MLGRADRPPTSRLVRCAAFGRNAPRREQTRGADGSGLGLREPPPCHSDAVPRFDAPFEHPDWILEPKLHGFRALTYVEDGVCRLVSCNRNAFKRFESLAQAIGQDLSGLSAILDGEIVRPGRRTDGRCSTS